MLCVEVVYYNSFKNGQIDHHYFISCSSIYSLIIDPFRSEKTAVLRSKKMYFCPQNLLASTPNGQLVGQSSELGFPFIK